MFNSISVIPRRKLTLFMSFWVSLVLGWGSEVSCPRTLPRRGSMCGSYPGPLYFESNTLPLSHAGPLHCFQRTCTADTFDCERVNPYPAVFMNTDDDYTDFTLF